MIDEFWVGAITGIIMLAALLIDTQTQWYISALIATGIYTIGHIIANELGEKEE